MALEVDSLRGRRSNSYGGEVGVGLSCFDVPSALRTPEPFVGSVPLAGLSRDSAVHGPADVADLSSAAFREQLARLQQAEADEDEDDEDADDNYDTFFRYDAAARRRMTATAAATRQEIEVRVSERRKAASDASMPSPSPSPLPATEAPVPERFVSEVLSTAVAPPALDQPTNEPSRRRNSSMDWVFNGVQLSRAQQQGCFKYMKRRHRVALDFAAEHELQRRPGAKSGGSNSTSPTAEDEQQRPPSNISPLDALNAIARDSKTSATDDSDSIWEFARAKHGVRLCKSARSRCEVRASTQVNASVKHVMALLAASPSTMGTAGAAAASDALSSESQAFAAAQRILLGSDQVLDARVLSSCVPSASGFFHCALKYAALKNPFGSSMKAVDLVYLDYTDVVPLENGQSVGFRVVESIRVPDARPIAQYTRASIRCEVYIVREVPGTPGVVQVTYAVHLDPKSKLAPRATTHFLDLAAARLANLRAYAEKRSFALRVRTSSKILHTTGISALVGVGGSAGSASGRLFPRPARCCVCQHKFSLLRKRHSCRVCGDASCGRCCRKLPVLVDAHTTTRVKVCLGCMLEARAHPDGRPGERDDEDDDVVDGDELARRQRERNDLSNSTFIIHD
jgi:hypothetical protein